MEAAVEVEVVTVEVPQQCLTCRILSRLHYRELECSDCELERLKRQLLRAEELLLDTARDVRREYPALSRDIVEFVDELRGVPRG